MTAPPMKPTTPAPIIETIPDELCFRKQWCAWKWEFVNERWTKVPYSPNGGSRHLGGKASTTDPASWASLSDANGYYQHAHLDGIGFVFAADDPYVGVDLDHVRDPESGLIDPWAQAYIDRLVSFTDVSVSQTGIHVLVKGALPPFGRRKGQFEIYQDKRFFTWSGAHLESTPDTIEDRGDVVQAIHAEVFGVRIEREPAGEVTPVNLDDAELLKVMFAAKNGAAIQALWDKTDERGESEGDAALAAHLLSYTGRDVERSDKLGRQSKRVRDKWDSPRGEVTWWRYTLENTLPIIEWTYTPPGPKLGGLHQETMESFHGFDHDERGAPADCAELREHIAELQRENNRLRKNLRETEDMLLDVKANLRVTRQLLFLPALQGKRAAVAVALVDEIGEQRHKRKAATGEVLEAPICTKWIAERAGCSEELTGTYLREFAPTKEDAPPGLFSARNIRGTTERADRVTHEVRAQSVTRTHYELPAAPRIELLKRFLDFERPAAHSKAAKKKASVFDGVKLTVPFEVANWACREHPTAPTGLHTSATCPICHAKGPTHQHPNHPKDVAAMDQENPAPTAEAAPTVVTTSVIGIFPVHALPLMGGGKDGPSERESFPPDEPPPWEPPPDWDERDWPLALVGVS